jgi:hypothetical protein
MGASHYAGSNKPVANEIVMAAFGRRGQQHRENTDSLIGILSG